MPGNVRLYVAETTKTEKIGHCNGNFFCNSKKTIKFSIAIKKTECYNHNIKVVKRRSYGSQSRLGNHQWAFILSQCCRTCSQNHSCNLHAMFFGHALDTMRGEMTEALT